ncbi:hypothetical protein PybrP1_003207, partial [[Pythium] brassicae (nom. inval.)]
MKRAFELVQPIEDCVAKIAPIVRAKTEPRDLGGGKVAADGGKVAANADGGKVARGGGRQHAARGPRPSSSRLERNRRRVAYVRLRRKEHANVVVLSSNEKYTYAKA